jgi:hypothetical protein
MKNLLRIAFVLISFMVVGQLSAQKLNAKAKEKIEADVAKMTEVMELTDIEKGKLLEARTTMALKFQNLNKTHEKGSEEFKAAKKEVSKEFQGELKNICGDKAKKWREYKKTSK